MADLAQLEAALVKADAAGDTAGATVLAGEVRKMRAAKQEPSLASKVVDYHPAVGLGETALALGTGAAGAVAGGFSGLGTIATNALGLTDTPPGDRVRQVSDALTYEPRGALGKRFTEAVSKPFELLAEGGDVAGGKVTDVTGSPALGAAVNTGIQSLPMALGPLAKALPGESAASIAARAKTKALNAPTDAGIAAAHKANLVLTPTQAEAGAVPRAVESLSGSARLEKAASRKNAPTVNDIIREDVGLQEDVPLSRQELAKVRAEEGAHYEAIKNTGRLETDARYKADLHKVEQSYDTAAKDFSHRSEKPFQKTLDGLRVDSFDAAAAVEEVKLLRSDADAAYAKGEKKLGKVYKELSQAVDDQLDRHLKNLSMTSDMSGDPAMAGAVKRYQEARTRIAKTYAADKALNDTTGNINADVYAKALKKGAPLTGGARAVGEFAQQFPRAAQRAERIGPTGPTAYDLLLPLISKEALLLGVRPAVRSLLLSRPVQEMLTAPRTYGPSAIRSLQELLAKGAGASPSAVRTAAGQRRYSEER